MMLVMLMKCSQKLIIGTCESTAGSQHACKTVVTCLTYTRLCGDLEYLKINTRLKDERFESVMGECVIKK